jgi:predicted DNA-binding WGR domain protein
MPPGRPILFVPPHFTTTVPIEYPEEEAMADQDYWYLENREAGSSKFYEIEVTWVTSNNTYIINTRHGRIGTKGRSLTPHTGIKNVGSARNTALSIAESKVAKGYKIIRDKNPNKKAEQPSAPKPAAGRFGRLMLEE